MKTVFLINHKFKRMFGNILSIVVVLAMMFPMTGSAYAQEPTAPEPFVRAHPVWDNVDAWNWPQDSTLQLTIEDPNTEASPDLVMGLPGTVDPNLGSVWFDFAGTYDLKPGDIVTLTDGVTTHSLIVSILSIDAVNIKTDTVSGTAEPGTQVRLPTGMNELLVTANAGGHWFADFKQIGFDLRPATMLIAEVFDEDGDNSSFERYIPNPRFTVFPEWEWFDGLDWPDGSSVTITVKGKPECKVTKESWGGFFNGNFGEGCDVVIGDEVTFADRNTTLRYVVHNLAITTVDPGENTITGMADPGTTVYVWPHDSWFEPIQAVADDLGVWQVDLSDAGYDLQGGASGRSEIRDDLGNATAVDWYVPNPHFEVRDEADSVAGWEWQPNGQVSITVDGSFIATAPVDENGYFNIVFAELVNLAPGSTVEVADDTSTKVHTVTSLSIQNVNVDTEFVTGIATPESRIQAEVCGPDSCIDRWEMVDGDGNWSADFSVPGNEPGEEQTYDFVPGTWVDSREWDEDGDNTIAGYYIPNPRLTIFPLWQWYDGLDWPNGAVYITVVGKPECDVTKTSSNYFFNGGFSSACHVEVGDTITFQDGTTTRTHVVRNLVITDIDLKKDMISGTADPGSTVYIWPHDGWFEPLQSVADNSGKWQVDLGDGGYDILEGAAGRAEVRDEFGNATAVDWNLSARIVVQITDDWFRAEGFAPDTSLRFEIYAASGGNRLLKSATAKTDSGGSITHWVGDQIDIEPGNHVIVSDGRTTKDIVVEALTFDVFDLSVGTLQGTAPAPFGRAVSVGVGCWQRDDLTADTTTDGTGAWKVDFHTSVPNDFGCVFAWIYDVDGDVSEARPAQIIGWEE